MTSPWVSVCAVDNVRHDRGIAAMVQSVPVAIFRLSATDQSPEDEWRAVSHVDPVTDVPVMARGMVGSMEIGLGVIPTVASPLHKQRYDLRTGACLDEENLQLEVFEVRIVNGWVHCRAAE